ncbi:hypothetical protein B0H21DRAFT_747422 [Amylocystis lapponica]|nr:hypothetical protein B0H21DRAFT_747422 [Amylocystis lapponica]
MLVLTSIPAVQSGLFSYPSIPTYNYRSELDIAAEQAAYDYALAYARAEALRRERARRLVEDVIRREAIRDALYRKQFADAPSRASDFVNMFPPVSPQYSLEEFLETQLAQERERRTLALARQHEYAHAISYPLEQSDTQGCFPMKHRRDHQSSLASMSAGYHIHSGCRLHSMRPSAIHGQSTTLQHTAGDSRHPSICALHGEIRERPERKLGPEVHDSLRNVYHSVQNVHDSLQNVLSSPLRHQLSTPVDSKAEGKSKATNAELPKSAVPSLLDRLASRMHVETDSDVQESLETLMQDLLGLPGNHKTSPPVGPTVDVKGKGKEKEVRFDVPSSSTSNAPRAFTVPIRSPSDRSQPAPQPSSDAPKLHRTPARPPALAEKILSFYRSRSARRISLNEIQEIENTLCALEASFVLPTNLDFTPPLSPAPSEAGSSKDMGSENGLAYTANNSPVHSYEHSLNGLLTRLDAVESGGDLEVRGRRKEVVRRVENALQDVGRRVEESRERSHERAAPSEASSNKLEMRTDIVLATPGDVTEGIPAAMAPAVVGAAVVSPTTEPSSVSAPPETADSITPTCPVLLDTPDIVQDTMEVLPPLAADSSQTTTPIIENAPIDVVSPQLLSVSASLLPDTDILAADPVAVLDDIHSEPTTSFSASPSFPSNGVFTIDAAADTVVSEVALSGSATPADSQPPQAQSPPVINVVNENMEAVIDGATSDSERDAFLLSLSSGSPSTVLSLPGEDIDVIQPHEVASDGDWSEVEA